VRIKEMNIRTFYMGTSYKVNLKKLTCNCPDFTKKRKKFDKDDPRRLCKHLVRSIQDPYDYYNFEVGSQVIYCQLKKIGFPCNNFRLTISIDNEPHTAYINKDPNKSWIDVFDKQNKYGFNVKEQRWSYGDAPKRGDDLIAPLISSWIKINGKIG
jgi:hypothetical protein